MGDFGEEYAKAMGCMIGVYVGVAFILGGLCFWLGGIFLHWFMSHWR